MASTNAQTTAQRKSDLISDISNLRIQIEDGIQMGSSMFGQYAHADVTNEVDKRLTDLKKKKEELENNIRDKEAIIQRSNRDFSDVKDALPEKQEQTRVKFVEDYTIMFLLLSFVFMVVSAIIFNVTISQEKMKALFSSLGLSILFTGFCGILLYFVA